MNDCIVAALDELKLAGFEGRVVPSRKHTKVYWEMNGRERFYVTGSTPSDHRAPLNVRSDIRRMIADSQPIIVNNVVPFVPKIVVGEDGALTDSRHVAETFDKEHRHVLRDIDNLLKNIDCPNLGSAFFRERYLPDGQGIDRRTFDMTRDGFSLLAMGFTGKKALDFKLRFIEAFNTMERALSRAVVPAADTAQLEAVKGDLAALTDLVLEMKPAPVKGRGRYIRASVLRKLRRAV